MTIPGHACTCGPTPTPLEQYAVSDAAFTGVVVSVTQDQAFPDFNDVTIFVTGVWKGVSTSTVHVFTPTTGAACGMTFLLTTEYLIYAFLDGVTLGEPLSTGLCTRTKTVSSAQEDLDALGPAHPVPVLSASWGIIKTMYSE